MESGAILIVLAHRRGCLAVVDSSRVVATPESIWSPAIVAAVVVALVLVVSLVRIVGAVVGFVRQRYVVYLRVEHVGFRAIVTINARVCYRRSNDECQKNGKASIQLHYVT